MGNIRFRGFFHHTLDDRKRLAIPSQFRSVIIAESDGRIVMTPGYDHEISVYALKTWEEFEEKELLSLSMDRIQARRYRRHFTFGIKEDRLDAQGRILIPDFLLEYSGIKKEVIVVGEIDYFSLWSLENYEKLKTEIDKCYPEDSETIEKLRRHYEGSNH
uniref:Transcriptional regulator MraZ n=1 Tax=candidate division WOR-3 bacterium TaxID=2052148 RepID=A0A7C4XL77_UNCW3